VNVCGAVSGAIVVMLLWIVRLTSASVKTLTLAGWLAVNPSESVNVAVSESMPSASEGPPTNTVLSKVTEPLVLCAVEVHETGPTVCVPAASPPPNPPTAGLKESAENCIPVPVMFSTSVMVAEGAVLRQSGREPRRWRCCPERVPP
jgi:hypothetical protein